MKLSSKWTIVCAYSICIFAVTPYLPNLINLATSRWQNSSVSRFVLYVEILIVLLILIFGVSFFILKKRKNAIILLISAGGAFLLSFILYKFLPNPYEFTHFPEYAILSILVMRALGKKKGRDKENGKGIKVAIIRNSYFHSGLITGFIGLGDEIYQHFLPRRFFNWYDICLNILGGVLGLFIFWGMKNRSA